jgi:hypothetical protein
MLASQTGAPFDIRNSSAASVVQITPAGQLQLDKILNYSAVDSGVAWGDGDTVAFESADDVWTLQVGGTVVARFDLDATAGNTRFLVYDVGNATLERVSVGAADSGGSGYKVLRIPN